MSGLTTFLGVDVGTSSVKALLVDAAGASLASASRPLVLHADEPLAAEQDAEDWWTAARDAVRDVLSQARSRSVAAVGLTGQKHALLALDARGRPLARAVLWADGRAGVEAARIARSVGLDRRTGAPALPGFFLPKWVRWRRRSRARADRTAHLLFAKDYVRFRLTGTYATDPTEASASRLYDRARGRWARDLAARFAVPVAALPTVVGCAESSGLVTAEAAAATGIPRGTPVVGGAGDNEAAALGAGAVASGVVAVILGTSGTIVANAARPGRPGALVWGAHALPGATCATGTVLSAGRALEWLRSASFPPSATPADVLSEAESASPDPPLLFLPSLVGERSPVPDPRASGAFVGLRPGHGRAHLARAVVEGISVAIGQTVQALRRARVPVREVRVTAGGAPSRFWRSLLAASCRAPVRLAHGAEGPALGAAMLAAALAGEEVRDLARRWAPPGPVERPARAEILRLARLSAWSSRARASLASAGWSIG